MHLHTLDFVVITLYLVGLLGVGFFFAGRQKGKEDYFLGNRKMPWFLVGISVVATLLSTVTYLAVPGEMIRYGIGFASLLLSFIFIIPFVNRIIIPFLMNLRVTSVYEYIEERFNVQTRLLAASAFIISRIIWTGLITYMASFAIASMTGWNKPMIILVIGLITTVYTSAGGIRAVMWTDFAQFVILFGGALFVLLYIAITTHTGPLTWWETFSAAGRTEVPVFSLDPEVRLTMVGMIAIGFIWNICTHGADQVAAQRYLSTPSAAAARRSVWIFSIANVGMILILMVIGLALFYFFFLKSGLPVQEFQEKIAPEADQLFPRFIATELPPGVSGLILAAILAAAMSSLSSAINSISTVAVTDFLDRFKVLEKYQDHLYLAVGMAVLSGLLGIFSALTVNQFMESGEWNLLELTERANHLFVAPLAVLFFVGILFPRADPRAALAGFFAGLATSIFVAFSKELFGMETPIGFIWVLPGSFSISFVVSWLMSLVFPQKPSAS